MSTLTQVLGRCLGHTPVPWNTGSQVLEGGDAGEDQKCLTEVKRGAKAEEGTFERLVSLERWSLWGGGAWVSGLEGIFQNLQ